MLHKNTKNSWLFSCLFFFVHGIMECDGLQVHYINNEKEVI